MHRILKIFENHKISTFLVEFVSHSQDLEISCSCTHLTAFAAVHNVVSGCDGDALDTLWYLTDLWDILIWIFFTIFVAIFVYAMYCSYYYRATYGWKRITILGVFLIGITSLLYAVCCVLDYHAMGTLRDRTAEDPEYDQGIFC